MSVEEIERGAGIELGLVPGNWCWCSSFEMVGTGRLVLAG